MTQMRALLKSGTTVQVAPWPRPAVAAADDVIIQVALAGVCRTDVYAASGLLPCRDPLILGHELAGRVVATGAAAGHLRPGTLVTVAPLWDGAMLGVDHHGAFAEFLRAPAQAVYPVPAGLSLREAAYAEPLAAALAVLKAGLRPGERGLIYGDGRIARLLQRVLAVAGHGEVPMHAPGAGPLPPGGSEGCDYIIETVAESAALAEMLAAIRPGGRLVLKSRPPAPVLLPVSVAVLREISLIAVAYGSFDEALRWLAERRLRLDDLLGEVYPLADFATAFAASRGAEARKIFLAPSGAAV